jgi:toxin ParE1/3/4
MGKVIFSTFVEAELAAIWDYIALDNLGAADRFLQSAYDTFQELLRTPHMGPLRKFAAPQLTALRSFRVRGFDNYLIFYRPTSEGIEIFHVLHGAQNLERFWEQK